MITASVFVVAGALLLLFPSRRRPLPKDQGIWVERKQPQQIAAV